MSGLKSFLGLLLLIGCSSPELDQPDVPSLDLREVSRIGTLDGVGSALSSVVGIAVTDSTVFVLESSPPRAAVFTRDGTWIQDLARAGDGPGELRRPSLIGVTDGGFWIGDPAGGRLEVFAQDGSHRASHRWDLAPDSLGARLFPTALLADGSILAGPGFLNLGAAGRGLVTHRAYRRVDESGEGIFELYREELIASDFMIADLESGGSIIGAHPVRESPLVAVYPDGSGLVVVERAAAHAQTEASFQIKVFSTDGSLETDLSIPYEPVSSTGWLDRHLRERETDMMERSGSVNRDIIAALRGALVDRPFYPPVTRLGAGVDGSIWVRREEVSADSVFWEVFRRDGELVGKLRTSASLSLHLASLEEVWGVERNELDVPFVIHFEVVH